MIVFTIIGIVAVVWAVFTYFSTKSKKTFVPLQTNNLKSAEDNSSNMSLRENTSSRTSIVFEQLVRTSGYMMQNLNPDDTSKAEIEMLLICITYTSIFCNQYSTSEISDQIDLDLLTKLESYLSTSQHAELIKNEFSTFNSFIRDRVIKARNDFKYILIKDDPIQLGYRDIVDIHSYSDCPINIYTAVMQSPLENFTDLSDSYKGTLNTPIYRFETQIAKLFISLTLFLQDNLITQSRFTKRDFSFGYELLDFNNYYPLFNNFCIECETFYDSKLMGDVSVYIEDFGTVEGRICSNCKQDS